MTTYAFGTQVPGTSSRRCKHSSMKIKMWSAMFSCNLLGGESLCRAKKQASGQDR